MDIEAGQCSEDFAYMAEKPANLKHPDVALAGRYATADRTDKWIATANKMRQIASMDTGPFILIKRREVRKAETGYS